MLLLLSTISVSLVIGSGGANCQWIVACPAPIAQKATCATRKSGPLYGGFTRSPDANPMEPGSTALPRKLQGSGPLHTSFCNSASKTEKSPVTVLVNTQPAEAASTFCNNP